VLAWPGSGQSDQATTKAIHQALPNATALVSNNFEGHGDLTSNHVTLDGTVNALVADSYLSDVFAPTPNDGVSDAGLLAGQRWLAQTALLTWDNEPGRIVVAAPPRDFEPSGKLLDALQAVGKLSKADQWVSFTGLDSVLAQPKTKKWTSPAAQSATKDEPVQQANLSVNVVAGAATAESTYLAYQSVLESKSTTDPALPYRTVATSWRGHPAEAKGYSDAVRKQINDLHDAVSLSPSAPLTLSGKTGEIPVTVRNNLLVPVTVNLHAVSGMSPLLSVTAQPETAVVPARGTKTVKIPVHVVGSGHRVEVTTQLCQPRKDGQSCTPYYPVGTDSKNMGTTVSDVKVSAIGVIALALMLGSAAVLVIGDRRARLPRQPGPSHRRARHNGKLIARY